MNSERLFGLDYVCRRWHSGQNSRGYKLLCKIGVVHRSVDSERLLPKEEWSEARDWAAHYTRLVRKGDIQL